MLCSACSRLTAGKKASAPNGGPPPCPPPTSPPSPPRPPPRPTRRPPAMPPAQQLPVSRPSVPALTLPRVAVRHGVAFAVLGLAALSFLMPSAPTYDPWSWIIWGREIVHLDLSTVDGPSWKPL